LRNNCGFILLHLAIFRNSLIRWIVNLQVPADPRRLSIGAFERQWLASLSHYEFSPFIDRTFSLGGDRATLLLRAESFNLANHANFVGYSGTYGNAATAGPGFGAPLVGITNQLPARAIQFSVKLGF
jgi:hypothetical protein